MPHGCAWSRRRVAGKEHENGEQNQDRQCTGNTGGGGEGDWDPGAASSTLLVSLLCGDASSLARNSRATSSGDERAPLLRTAVTFVPRFHNLLIASGRVELR